MSKRLLYLFGEPGTGKITVARLLKERLKWRLFWLHDLDKVCSLVGRYPLPRLMDKISLLVLEEMMLSGDDIIYVRPSRDAATIHRVLDKAKLYNYEATAVRLTATYDELVRRVTKRPKDDFRLNTQEQLDTYRKERKLADDCDSWTVLDTTGLSPERVADKVQELLGAG